VSRNHRRGKTGVEPGLCHTPGVSDLVFRANMLVAAVAAVIARVLFVAAVPVDIEFGDAETYRLLGALLVEGEGYIRPREFLLQGERVPTAEFPPLWPMVLGVLDLLGFDGISEQRAFGAILGGATVVVVGLLGTALADRRVGVIAAFLAAAHPQLIVLDTSLLAEGLTVPLVAVALLGLARARAAGGDVVGPDARRWWWLASIAFGLAALTRTEMVVLAVVLVVPGCRMDDRRAWARAAVMGLAGVLVCVGAWTARNLVTMGELQPFTNNSGTLLAGANCDAVYSGSQIGLWRFDCVTAVDTSGLDEAAASHERRAAGISHALDNPGDLPGVGVVRVLRTFGAWDVRTQLYFESFEGRDYRWLWAGWFGWIGVAAAAAGGAFLVDRSVWQQRWLLVVPLGVVALTALASYGNQRFRASAEPGTLVLAAIGLVAMADRLRRQPAQAPTGSS